MQCQEQGPPTAVPNGAATSPQEAMAVEDLAVAKAANCTSTFLQNYYGVLASDVGWRHTANIDSIMCHSPRVNKSMHCKLMIKMEQLHL